MFGQGLVQCQGNKATYCPLTCLGGSKSRQPGLKVVAVVLGVDGGVEGVDFGDVVDGVEGVVVREDVGVEGVEVEGVDGQDQLKTWTWQSKEQFT